jgi:hypothetical protein
MVSITAEKLHVSSIALGEIPLAVVNGARLAEGDSISLKHRPVWSLCGWKKLKTASSTLSVFADGRLQTDGAGIAEQISVSPEVLLSSDWLRGWCQLAFVVSMRAAQKWHLVEDVFLEPLEPEINHRSNKERDQLGKDEAADDHQPERTTRRSILAKPERQRNCSH